MTKLVCGRVAHVSSAHPWTDNRIHGRECISLQEAGYDVHLIAVAQAGSVPGSTVSVHLLPARTRFNRLLLSTVHAVWLALRTRSSIIHLHDPELVPFIPLLRMCGRAVIFDAHEDLELQVLSKAYIHTWLRPLAKRLARTLTKAAARADHVVAATEGIGRRFPDGVVTTIHNYARLRPGDASSHGPRNEWVVYVGAITDNRGAKEMIAAAKLFPPGWSLVVAGQMQPATLESTYTAVPGWSRVDYRGSLPPEEARDLVSTASIGIVILQRTEAYLQSLPTKLFEYMAAGIPVVASNFPLWRDIIEEADCGTVVDESNPRAVAEAVARYACDKELARRHGENGRLAAHSTYNWLPEESKLLQLYRETSYEAAAFLGGVKRGC